MLCKEFTVKVVIMMLSRHHLFTLFAFFTDSIRLFGLLFILIIFQGGFENESLTLLINDVLH